jgi:nucleoside-diphosphate-sugar epimerase
MKILITGSTGFVGRHLVIKLLKDKHEILELTIEPNVSTQLYGNKTEKFIINDDQEALVKCIESFKPEIVIHLASFLTSIDDYVTLNKLITTNIVFFCRLLDAVKNSGIKLFINTGTFAEYFKGDDIFDPAYLYAATKTASRSFLDYYSKVYCFKQVTVVPYTIYGGQEDQKKIIDLIYDSISCNSSIDLSPGEQVLDFIHIDDVTDFYLRLIENKDNLPQKSNFRLGVGNGHTLKQLARIIEVILNQKTKIHWGGIPYRATDVMYAVADISKINFWKPLITLEDGVAQYIKNRQI